MEMQYPTGKGQIGAVNTAVNGEPIDQRVWHIRDAIQEKLNPQAATAKPMMAQSEDPTYWVRDLYDTFAILCKAGKFYRVDYAIDGEGNIQLGEMVEVAETWTPVTKSLMLGRFAEPEIKSGRRNSSADVDRLKKIQALLAELLSDEQAEAEAETGKGEDSEAEAPADEMMDGKAISEREDVSDADKDRAKDEYGDVTFADEKNKKYPIDTEEHVRSALSYIRQEKNRAKYSDEEAAQIEKRIIAAWKKLIDPDGPPSAEEKSISLDDDLLITIGTEIKILGETSEGVHIGGKLVRFSSEKDADLSDTHDFFDGKTDFCLEPGERRNITLYFHHALPLKTKDGGAVIVRQKIGKGIAWLGPDDDPGVLIDAIAWNRTNYEKAIVGNLKMMGFSSGTAPHLVQRSPVGKANHIDRWPIGDDATVTPTPADYKNHVVVTSVKSLDEALTELFTVPAATANTDPIVTSQTGDLEMLDEETKKMIADTVSAAVKAALPEQPAGGVSKIIETKTAPAVVEDKSSDNDGMKAMARFIRYGDIAHDLRPDVGSKYYEPVDSGDGMKTTYNWSEGGTYDGYALVPPQYWNVIQEKRYEKSIFRAMKCQVITTSSNKMMIPVEYAREAVMVKTTEATGESDQTTTEPVAQKEVDVFMWTRKIPATIQLLNDANTNVEAFLSNRVAKIYAVTENSVFTVGSGNGATDVEGVMVGGTAGKTFASASAIAQGEPEDLFYSLPSYYQEEAVWGMRNATLGKIRKITGNWFSYQGMPAGVPATTLLGDAGGTLLNKPVFLSDYFAAVGASAKSVIVGNPEYYAIVENQGLLIQRNPYDDSKHGIVNFYCYARFGGGVLQSEAWSYATHPSA